MASKLSLFNFLLAILFLPHVIAVSRCEVGHFGPRCQYVCHCEDVNACNMMTGECGSSCANGWDGYSCQRENIALNRRTTQSSTSYRGNSEKAVDGETCSYYDEHRKAYSCTHTTDLPYSEPYWMVFLDQATYVNYMQIFNRDDTEKKYSHRLQKFHVIVSHNSSISTGVECYRHNNTKFVFHTFHCDEPIFGSVVIVKLYHVEPLTICEFKVFRCTNYWFGKDCSQPCNCRNSSEVCNPVTGSCLSGKLKTNIPVLPQNGTATIRNNMTPHTTAIILGVLLALALLTVIILIGLLIQKSNFVNRFSINRLQF